MNRTVLAGNGHAKIVLNHTYDGNKKLLKIQGSTYFNDVEVGTTTFDFTFQNGRKISQKQSVY